jgi:hypothetical protein
VICADFLVGLTDFAGYQTFLRSEEDVVGKGFKLPPVKYPPELLTPYVPAEPRVPGIGLRRAEYEAAREQDQEIRRERFRMLIDFYDAYDESGHVDWPALARRLAEAHLPGLHPTYSRRRGRPSKRHEQLQLYLEVLKILYASRVRSVANACKRLAREQPVLGGADSIETRFHEARRWLVENTPADVQIFEPRFGYPVNCTHETGLWGEFLDFRVRYAKLPGEFP